MPFLIGQCCVDQIAGDPTTSTGSGLNELVYFTNVSSYVVNLTATRRARFGDALVLQVEIKGEDNQYRFTTVEIKPNQITDTAYYTIDFGGLATGRITIT